MQEALFIVLSVGQTFTWIPDVPESGVYEVYAYWTYHSQCATNVPYRVYHADGVATHIVNQKDPNLGGQWVFLGNYTFNQGSSGSVEVSSENGQCNADVVRLYKAGQSEKTGD